MASNAANVDEVFQVTRYRCNKAGFLGDFSSADFNLLFPRAEIRYYNKEYALYASNEEVSDTMAKFKSDPLTITIDGTGRYDSPSNMLHVDAIYTTTTQQPIVRVESDRVANNLASAIELPTTEFPIYSEYTDYLQFYPINLGSAKLIYLMIPRTTVWGYTLAGGVGAFTLTGGSGYSDGLYTVALTGGAGNSATASVTVSGGVVTAVVVRNAGMGYFVGDPLTGTVPSGTGWSLTLTSITNGRQVYDPTTSVDPLWQVSDLDSIIYLLLQDIGIYNRDAELESFAVTQAKLNPS